MIDDQRRRPSRDGGFTLVEMLISIVITGIVAGALGSALDVVTRNDSAVTQRFSGANDSLATTNVFAADIASTPPGGREVGAELASECDGADPAGSRNVLRLTWSEQTGGATTYYRVSYRIRNDVAGEGNLVRVSCTSPSSPHAGFGTAEARPIARALLPVPAGWTSGAPAALTYAALDADAITLTLHLDTSPPSTATMTGTRMNRASTLPPPPVVIATAGLRVLTTTTTSQYTHVGNLVELATIVFNAGTTFLTSVAIADPAADTGSISCSTAVLAVGASATCTFTHVVTQADLDAGTVASKTTATAIAPLSSTTVTALAPAVTVPAVQTLQLTAAKTTATPGYKVAGDLIDYTVTVANTGNVSLSAINVTDPRADGAIACGAPSLAPGATTDCAYSYTVGGGDLVVGASVSSAAGVGAVGPLGNPAPAAASNSVSVPFQANPAMGAIKQADQSTFAVEGAVVQYAITVTNSGNVSLSAISVADAKDSDGAIPCAATALLPGASTTCTAAHVVDANDIAVGAIHNEATVTAAAASGGAPIVTMTNEETVTYSQAPALRLITTTVEQTYANAGDLVHYTFTVRNTGAVLLGNVIVNDPRIGVTSPCGSGTLAVLAETTCTATYTVTPADVGSAIVSNGFVTADSDAGPASANANTVTVNLQANPRVAVTMTASPSPEFTTLGEVITYTMTIINTGNVPLSAVGISAVSIGTAPACDTATLAVGASATCTSSYATTGADAGGQPVTNQVTASGSFGSVPYSATSGTLTIGSTVPCSVSAITASPASVARNGGNGANKNKLSTDVTVTVATSGKCSGLRLQYYPQGTLPGIVDAMTAASGVWTYVIQKGTGQKASNWQAGPARVDVLAASGTAVINTTQFEPFTVT